MSRLLARGMRLLGILLLAQALMLIGADEITMLERHLRTVRSLDTILTLYTLDPKPWMMTLSPFWSGAVAMVMSWPGWAVFGGLGASLSFIFRSVD